MRKLVFWLITILVFSGCTERIDIELDPNYERLVVDGEISTDTGSFIVNLTKTADYFYNAPIPKVGGATVQINDGTTTFHLMETTSGVYATSAGFHGVAGKTYTLSVELEEPIGGEKDFQADCRLTDVAHLDSIQTEFHPDWGKKGIWEIRVFAQEPGNEVNYYMFRYYRNGKLISDTISKVAISDDTYFNGSYISGLTAIYVDQERYWETLHPGDTVMMQMSGITKEYYNFIYQVQIAGFNIPFFMGPPANAVGNISNNAVGFFAAYSSSYATTIVKELHPSPNR